ESPLVDTVIRIPNLGAGGPAATLTVPAGGSTATIAMDNYADPGEINAFSLDSNAAQALSGKTVTVHIDAANPAAVSLAYVHYLREAIKNANAASVSVNAPADKITPVFDGKEWWMHGLVERNLYSSYPTDSDTMLLNDIKVSRNASNNKYVLIYNRALRISRPVWQENSDNEPAPFHGFGLIKGTNGSIAPISGDWGNISILVGQEAEEINTHLYYPTVSNWAAYETALKEAGLHPTDGVLLNHGNVMVQNAGANVNIANNGMYDFILAYYNPKADGSFPAGASDLKDRLPNTRGVKIGLAFDGSAALPAGISSRNIGGQTADSLSRKGARETTGTPAFHVANTGEPRADFVGHITVPMANYLKSTLLVPEFKNTNIIGDADQWDNIDANNREILDLVPTINVGLIGNYDIAIRGNLRGVTDIKGTIPEVIGPGSNPLGGYLNLWNNVSRETFINAFAVVYARNSGDEKIVTGVVGHPDAYSKVIIHSNKYDKANLVPDAAGVLKPYHRAFLDGATPKITPTTDSSIDAAYRGLDTSGAEAVPPLDEASWINAANANNGAAPAFMNYASAPKWEAAAFNAIPVASTAPAKPAGVRLAGGVRHELLAVIPSRFRGRE
ncbi:MAG: hypothetical protein LBQ30_01845, partial [Treponema sp.]|nr:hypothetical protein [Treponema sp.]